MSHGEQVTLAELVQAMTNGNRFTMPIEDDRFYARTWRGTLLFYTVGSESFAANVKETDIARNLAAMLVLWANAQDDIVMTDEEAELAKRLFGFKSTPVAYRLGCEDITDQNKDWPVQPDCIDLDGQCGCGRG